jgi:hypothetical protein
VSRIKLALLTEICNSDRRREIHAGKDGRRLVEERGQIQFLCFFQNILMNHSVSCRENLHFMLNFRHLSIESPIQRNDLLSHPHFKAVRQSSSGPSADASLQRGQNLPSFGSPTAIYKLFKVLSNARLENSLDIKLLEIFITLLSNIQISSFCLQLGYCFCDS